MKSSKMYIKIVTGIRNGTTKKIDCQKVPSTLTSFGIINQGGFCCMLSLLIPVTRCQFKKKY